MSDHLGHLVARATSPQTGVQPRLQSVFETVSQTIGFVPGIDPASGDEPPPVTPLPYAPAPPRARTPTSIITGAAEDAVTESDCETRLAPGTSEKSGRSNPTAKNGHTAVRVSLCAHSPSDDDPSLATKEIATVSPSAMATQFAAEEGVTDVEPRTLHKLTSTTVRVRDLPPRDSVVSVPPPSTLRAPSDVDLEQECAVKPAEFRATPPVTPEKRNSKPVAISAIRPVVPGNTISFPSTLIDSGNAVTSSAPLAPTVHVTIGRVEVRATATHVPPAHRSPAAPPSLLSSLERYLHGRTTGGRQ